MWASQSDEALLAGLETGDPGASVAFVRRFQARVYGLARTIVGEGSAEEIAQEAFLRAWRYAGAYDPRRGQVATWLLSITRNLAIDEARRRRTDPIEPESLMIWADRAGVDPGSDRLDRGPAWAAMAAVPEEQRRALLLAVLFGFTAREIGEIEGLPVGTMKTRIRSALMKLRNELGATDEQ